jgi:hypothetical protein
MDRSHIYIYIYIERERERETGGGGLLGVVNKIQPFKCFLQAVQHKCRPKNKAPRIITLALHA